MRIAYQCPCSTRYATETHTDKHQVTRWLTVCAKRRLFFMSTSYAAPSDPETAGRIQENMPAYFRLFAGLPGITVVDADVFWLVNMGAEPGNHPLRARIPSATAERRIDEVFARIGLYADQSCRPGAAGGLGARSRGRCWRRRAGAATGRRGSGRRRWGRGCIARSGLWRPILGFASIDGSGASTQELVLRGF